MNIKSFLRHTPIPERQQVATAAGTTVEYLIQLAGGHRKPSPEMARRLEKASNGALTKEEMRPDIWPVEETQG